MNILSDVFKRWIKSYFSCSNRPIIHFFHCKEKIFTIWARTLKLEKQIVNKIDEKIIRPDFSLMNLTVSV